MSSVVFAAHLDDAVLSCYRVLGRDTTVVTVLAAVPPVGVAGYWDVEGGTSDSQGRMLARHEEDRRALARSGSAVVHLGFADSQYVGLDGVSTPTVEAIAEALRPFVARAEAVFAPAGIFNLDHKLVRDAVLSVSPGAVLYADLPYALHPDMGGFALPPEVATGRIRRDEWLSAALLAEKIDSFHCYETQLDQLLSFYGPFDDEDGLGLEVYWTPAVP